MDTNIDSATLVAYSMPSPNHHLPQVVAPRPSSTASAMQAPPHSVSKVSTTFGLPRFELHILRSYSRPSFPLPVMQKRPFPRKYRSHLVQSSRPDTFGHSLLHISPEAMTPGSPLRCAIYICTGADMDLYQTAKIAFQCRSALLIQCWRQLLEIR